MSRCFDLVYCTEGSLQYENVNYQLTRVRRIRLSTSICFSPIPFTRPPACLSRWVHNFVNRGSWYSNCASSTYTKIVTRPRSMTLIRSSFSSPANLKAKRVFEFQNLIWREIQANIWSVPDNFKIQTKMEWEITCKVASRVAARWLNMSKINAVLSQTRTSSPNAFSKFRACLQYIQVIGWTWDEKIHTFRSPIRDSKRLALLNPPISFWEGKTVTDSFLSKTFNEKHGNRIDNFVTTSEFTDIVRTKSTKLPVDAYPKHSIIDTVRSVRWHCLKPRSKNCSWAVSCEYVPWWQLVIEDNRLHFESLNRCFQFGHFTTADVGFRIRIFQSANKFTAMQIPGERFQSEFWNHRTIILYGQRPVLLSNVAKAGRMTESPTKDRRGPSSNSKTVLLISWPDNGQPCSVRQLCELFQRILDAEEGSPSRSFPIDAHNVRPLFIHLQDQRSLQMRTQNAFSMTIDKHLNATIWIIRKKCFLCHKNSPSNSASR